MDFSLTQWAVAIAINVVVPLAILSAIAHPEQRPATFLPALVGGIPVVATIWALGVPPWHYGYFGCIAVFALSWTVGFVITMATGAFDDYVGRLR